MKLLAQNISVQIYLGRVGSMIAYPSPNKILGGGGAHDNRARSKYWGGGGGGGLDDIQAPPKNQGAP